MSFEENFKKRWFLKSKQKQKNTQNAQKQNLKKTKSCYLSIIWQHNNWTEIYHKVFSSENIKFLLFFFLIAIHTSKRMPTPRKSETAISMKNWKTKSKTKYDYLSRWHLTTNMA